MRTRAWLHAAALSLLTYSASSVAAPLVFEETALIMNPDTTWRFPGRVAIDGDTLIATAQRDVAGEGEEETFVIQVAWLFERQSDGRWDFVRTLVEDTHVRRREDPRPMTVAIRNGRAAIHTGRVWVFERTANGWVEQPSDAGGGDGDVAVGGNAIVASFDSCSYDTNAFTRNNQGVWTLAGTTDGLDNSCDTEAEIGTDVDMSPSDHFIVGQPGEAHVYERTSAGWMQAAILRDPVDARRFSFGDEVAMNDDQAFVSSITPTPIQVFGRQPGGWMHRSAIAPPESALLFSPQVMKLRDVLAAGFSSDGYRGGSIGLFRRNSEGGYDHVARLVAKDASEENFFPQAIDVWTNGSLVRVAGATADKIYVFEVNQLGHTLAPLQETFESGNAAQWSTLAGSSFAVVSSGGSNVYRQSYFGGDAAAYLTSIDWTNQAIEAEVRPTAFNGFDRWAGLIVRRTDARNYYYLTLRSSSSLQIRRMLNGQIGRLASAQLTVNPNRTYKLRLEAVGTRLRAFVNGRLATEVSDSTLTHGHVGLMTYKTRADFDNIVVSQNPNLQLINPEIAFLSEYRWSFGPGTWRPLGDYVDPVAQTSTSGDARAVTLVDAKDQAIQVRAQATAFASGTGSKWFGVMARYVDDRNYYYVTLRNSNEISLRKLVNGTIHVLDSAPLTVTPGIWYTIGLEVIGDRLRGRVNGSVRVEATDSTHSQGRYGLVSYKTAAQYQEFIAYQP